MATVTDWCYYDFSTGINNGWYRQGTYPGSPLKCVTQAARPSYIPAAGTTTTTPQGHAVSISTGTGVGFFAAVIVAAYAAAVIRKQTGRKKR